MQCVRVGAGAKEVESDMFGAGKDVRQTKLRVVLLTPPKPPSPVPEGTEEPNSPASSAFQPVVSAAGASTGGGGGGGAAAEKLDIKRRLDMLEEAPGGAAPRAAGRKVGWGEGCGGPGRVVQARRLAGERRGQGAQAPKGKGWKYGQEGNSTADPASPQSAVRLGSAARSRPSLPAQAVVRVGGYTVMHLFVVAVLAFIIGQITQFVVLPRVFGS